MKKFIKWTLLILASLIALIILTGLVLYPIGKKKLTQSYANIRVESVGIPTDADAIARGRHVSVIWACTNCHGDVLSGRSFTRDPIGGAIPVFGTIPASNLTSGKGGIGRFYSDADWIRAIRHGVKPNNQPEVFMYVTTISDQDLGDLIAYLKQIPPVNSDESAIKWGPIIPIASAIGVFPPVAGTIDHNAPRPPDPAPAVTKEYGKYLSAICAQCHIGGIAYAVKNWKQEDFIHAINTGYAPDGKLIGPTMSSQTFREMNEKELSALWLYLQSQH